MPSHASRLVTACKVVAVTPNAGADLPDGVAQSLYIGVAGNLTFDDGMGNQIASTAVVAGPFPAQ